jgi:hypothetical protein
MKTYPCESKAVQPPSYPLDFTQIAVEGIYQTSAFTDEIYIITISSHGNTLTFWYSKKTGHMEPLDSTNAWNRFRYRKVDKKLFVSIG